MGNEVVIKITSRSDTRSGFLDAKKDTEKFADETAEIYTKRFGERMKTLGEKLTGPLARSGQEIGKQLSERTTTEFERGFTEKTVDLSKVMRVNITNGGAEITRAGQEIGGKLGAEIGQRSGDTITENISQTVRTRLTQRVRESVNRIGDESHSESAHAGDVIGRDIGDRAGRTIRERITEHIKRKIKVDTDTDTDIGGSLAGRFEKEGRAIGDKMSGGIGASLSSFFSGDLVSLLIKVLAAAGIATAVAPVLGAALSSAFLLAAGGLPLAVGIIGALRDPRIKAATKELKTDILGAIAAFGQPFRAPVAEFLEKFDRFLRSPAVKAAGAELARIFAPIAGELGTGVLGMLQNMLPGITDAAKAAAPLFETLAKHLPEIGQRIGDFFRDISEGGPTANMFFGDLLTLVEKLIGVLGRLIHFLTTMYAGLRLMVTNSIAAWHNLTRAVGEFSDKAKEFVLRFTLYALDKLGLLLAGAATALSWIPGIGPKLKAAEGAFNRFRNHVNDQLQKIHDRDVAVRVHVIGLAAARAAIGVARTLHNLGMAHGGIKGAAAGGAQNGLTWVGENGPELADIPPGTTVHSAADSQRMMRQAGAGQSDTPQRLLIEAAPGLESTLAGALVKALRIYIDGQGGNVQTVLGSNR